MNRSLSRLCGYAVVFGGVTCFQLTGVRADTHPTTSNTDQSQQQQQQQQLQQQQQQQQLQQQQQSEPGSNAPEVEPPSLDKETVDKDTVKDNALPSEQPASKSSNVGLQAYTAGSKANTTGPQVGADSFSGYLSPNFGFRYRPVALPRDRWEYGVLGTPVGLIYSGKHFNYWSYTAHLSFNPFGQTYVTDVAALSTPAGALPGASTGGGFIVAKATGPALGIQEIALTFQPKDYIAFRGGYMFIPFTAQGRSPNTALLFPSRATANDVFVSGADRGLLVIAGTSNEVIQGSIGAFNGASLGLTSEQVTSGARGFVYSFRVDVNPYGKFPFSEGDPKQGNFRLGFGIGALYRPATVFEGAGYESVNIHDFRFSASLRMAYRGFFLSTEYLRRQEIDNLTRRAKIATGAYMQASFFRLVSPSFALGPIGRLGLTVEDQDYFPRTTGYLEAGMSFYPYADQPNPNVVKIIVNYQGENRITENEYAHGVNVAFQLAF